ncbi:hypothetical protein B0T10DRAFT_295242 [Thelonectria olida]|uniref:Uncharacterized protein n=1 Tax=Thelonectria olida TaxID=1576542 RepID=A0A9P9ANX9_9HYPO|nr:hypothetical protein B0T10DRAFT_295242 [Thelonectria olida]
MAENDPFAGIDSIDWKSLNHAYGSAEDVPDILRELQSSDENVRAGAYCGLYSNIFHQGTRYDATPFAVPFLYNLLDDPATPQKDELMQLLVSLAIGIVSYDEPVGMNVVAWRNHIASLQDSETQRPTMVNSMAEVEKEQGQAGQEKEICDDSDNDSEDGDMFEDYDTEARLLCPLIEYRSYRAVQDGIDSICARLQDESAVVRANAAYALAWFPDVQQKTQAALFDLLDHEQDVGVRATALFSLAVTQAMTGDFSETQVVQRLRAVNSDEHSDIFIRWVSSLGLVKLKAFTPEQLSDVIHKLADESYLEEYEPSKIKGTSFVFVDHGVADLTALAALETECLKGSEYPELAKAIISAFKSCRGLKLLTLTETALRVVFDGEKPSKEQRFEDFHPVQQELVGELAVVDETNWHLLNFSRGLQCWNLPHEEAEMREFAKTWRDVPSKL